LSTSDRLEVRLLEVLRSAPVASSKLVSVTVPAPTVAPELVFDCLGFGDAYHFATGEAPGEALGDVGLDSVITLEANRIEELSSLELSASQYLNHCFEVGLDAAARPPRFSGGFAFDGPLSKKGNWHHFPRIFFQLPRYRYVTDGRRATLTLLVATEEIGTLDAQRSWVDRTLKLLNLLADRLPTTTLPPVVTERQEFPERSKWLDLVERARNEIRQGDLEKVVLAREIALKFDSAPSVSQTLSRLARLAKETTRFAFRRKTSVFLGATPERLVMRSGSEIRTEALAGSIRASNAGAGAALLNSEKERHEHQLVVREIERKLGHLDARIERTALPQIRNYRHVLHLFTPITARIFRPPHVLSLAAQLHPTPAVGGVPESQARQFIRHHEGFERGYYAGTIGWFDAAGDGEFFVALRSGLLEGNRIFIYAGAGIVSDSNAEREFEETQLKFESLLDALGAEHSTTAHES
jgi:menaquinone-specific isochorismate synthase